MTAAAAGAAGRRRRGVSSARMPRPVAGTVIHPGFRRKAVEAMGLLLEIRTAAFAEEMLFHQGNA